MVVRLITWIRFDGGRCEHFSSISAAKMRVAELTEAGKDCRVEQQVNTYNQWGHLLSSEVIYSKQYKGG
jgi:hypothetical protein